MIVVNDTRFKEICFVGFLLTPLLVSLWLTFGLGYRLLFNTTHSLAHHVYLATPTHGFLQRGVYIAFKHNASTHVVVKRVIGVEGDRIEHDAHVIVVHKTTLSLKEKRSNGTALTPLNASIVPAGMVFVAGDHPDSFDSRYNEFGLVPLSTVRGRVWPVF